MKNLTSANIDKMVENDNWEGFGYIGERQNQFSAVRSGESDVSTLVIVEKADAMLLESANRQGMTEDQLFRWANSKIGRWYGDCWFGSNGNHAEKYLPVI